jgi:Flp pilus assembly pilin Flp
LAVAGSSLMLAGPILPRSPAPEVRPRHAVVRVALIGCTLVFVGLFIREWVDLIAQHGRLLLTAAGPDYRLYMEAARRWLDGGGYYLPSQLAGPYAPVAPDVLYPPTSLLLFVPLSYLPALVYWLVPLGLTAWAIWRLRPRMVAWPVMAMCLWFPTTSEVYWAGNPVIWVIAALALGGLYGWPSIFALLKPTVAPFALLGIWRRSWWFALAGLVVLSLPFLPMWPDYFRAMLNAGGAGGWAYSLNQVPTLLLPIAAWLGSETRVTSGAEGSTLSARDRLRRQTTGQGFIEYGLILALMAIVAILALTLFGAQVSHLVNMFAQ